MLIGFIYINQISYILVTGVGWVGRGWVVHPRLVSPAPSPPFLYLQARDAAARGDLLGAKRWGLIADSLNAAALIPFAIVMAVIIVLVAF